MTDPEPLDSMKGTARPMLPAVSLNICGFGKVARLFVEQAAALYPDSRFRIVSRDPERVSGTFPANVTRGNYDVLRGNKDPILVCLCEDEQEIIKSEYRKGATDVPRTIVARPNSLALKSVLVPEHWRDRVVFILTNPVEIICEFLYRQTGNRHIYGVGMLTDKDRILEGLASGFGVDACAYQDLEVTGLHFSRPIPVLSVHPELVEKMACVPLGDSLDWLASFKSEFSLRPEKVPEFLRQIRQRSAPSASAAGARSDADCYELIHSIVLAITLTEFEENRPPTRRTVSNLLKLLAAIRNKGRIEVSGRARCGSQERFVGGTLDLKSLAFRVAALGPIESGLLGREISRHEDFFSADALMEARLD